MRALLILGIVLALCCPVTVSAQTLEQAKKQQVEAALKGPNGAVIKTSVKKYSEMYKIEETLILAVIQTESGFNPRAVSSQGCSGLMQLAPSTFRARNVGTNIYDIDQNIAAGTKHLRGLYDKYRGDKVRMLAAYNYGGGRIFLNKPIPAGAQQYANRVLYNQQIIKTIKF